MDMALFYPTGSVMDHWGRKWVGIPCLLIVALGLFVGLDWLTGEIRARWIFPDDSCIWNAFGGITTILEDGDLLIGGAFAIKRLIA